MARPKTIKQGQKLNLYVPKQIKQQLFRLASERGKSMSAICSELIAGAAKLNQAA